MALSVAYKNALSARSCSISLLLSRLSLSKKIDAVMSVSSKIPIAFCLRLATISDRVERAPERNCGEAIRICDKARIKNYLAHKLVRHPFLARNTHING